MAFAVRRRVVDEKSRSWSPVPDGEGETCGAKSGTKRQKGARIEPHLPKL